MRIGDRQIAVEPGPWLVVPAAVALAAPTLVKAGRKVQQSPHQTLAAILHVHQPRALLAARATYHDAHATQRAQFGVGSHVDDSIDAFRHAYGSGLLFARLQTRVGMTEHAATGFVRALGVAHERDARDNRSALSSAMDVRNNDAGIDIARRLLRDGPVDEFDGALASAVRDAMESGRLVRVASTTDGLERLLPTVAAALR